MSWVQFRLPLKSILPLPVPLYLLKLHDIKPFSLFLLGVSLTIWKCEQIFITSFKTFFTYNRNIPVER
jgi:hypothetical protein